MACGGGSRVKPSLESLLDNGLQGAPCLGSKCQMIPVLKRLGVESCHEEETDGICYKLQIHVGVAVKEGRLSIFFDSAKEDFRSAGGWVRGVEYCVIGFEYGGCGLSVDCAELIKNIDHLHASMPSLYYQVIGDLEGIVDACIKGSEACPLNVPHQ